MTTATDTRESLSAALKTSTAEAHDKAEHSVFMDDLLAGKLSVADFIALQEQSWLFYSALEDAARAVADSGDGQLNITPGWVRGSRCVHGILPFLPVLKLATGRK